MQTYRDLLAGTDLANASAETIRSRLIKIAARVRRTVRRVWWPAFIALSAAAASVAHCAGYVVSAQLVPMRWTESCLR